VPVIGVRTVSPNRRIRSEKLFSTVIRNSRLIPISVILGKVVVLSILKISILWLACGGFVLSTLQV